MMQNQLKVKGCPFLIFWKSQEGEYSVFESFEDNAA